MRGTVARKRALDRDRAAERGDGVREGEEEAVALQLELDAAVRSELLAHDRVVGLDDPVSVAVAEALGHLGEALHVAEHESDAAVGGGEAAQVGTPALDARGDGVDRGAHVGRLDALRAELVGEHTLDPARAVALAAVALDRGVELLDRPRALARGEERAAPLMA